MSLELEPEQRKLLSQSRAWRAVCRYCAQARAEEEAFHVWPVDDDALVPFQHRWEHVQEVVRLALGLAEETGADAEIVEAAAWLHDVCKEQSKHAEAGAKEARQILTSTDFPPEKIDAVTDAIRQHSGNIRPAGVPRLEPLEAAVVWDADKLSKLGVSALTHRLSSHSFAGLSLHERRAELDEYVHDTVVEIVQSMNTGPARRYAEDRYRAMVQMLDAWLREEDEPKA